MDAKSSAGHLRIGTSGYQYRHWRERFYPRELPTARWLEFYAERFDAVEINNTFYNLPAPSVFERWRERTPAGFRFALKLSRFATHWKRLLDPEPAVEAFVARARLLGPKLGPILVQLPPRFAADPARLDAFLAVVPGDLRWTVEFRDPSWLREEVFDSLRRRGAALCVHDKIRRHPRTVTADFAYWRFHGADGRREGGYSPPYLAARAREIEACLERGLDVDAYFNNDWDGHALVDAARLRRFLERAPAA